MEETKQHFWHIMVYYFKTGKSTAEMEKKKYAMYGGVMTDQTSSLQFPAGNFLLDDALQLVDQFEVDSGQIETLIENHQHYTTQERAHILKIFKKALKIICTSLVGFHTN